MREPHQSQHDAERDQRRQRAAREQPHAPKDDVQERKDQQQRAHAVPDALVLHERFGVERNQVAAGEHDVQYEAGCRANARWSRSNAIEPLEERVREPRVVRWLSRLRDHEPSPSVGAHVAGLRQADREPGARAAELSRRSPKKSSGS